MAPNAMTGARMERDSRKLIALLKRDGWYEARHKGSHRQFKRRDKPGRVTVPVPEKELKRRTVESIYKQAG